MLFTWRATSGERIGMWQYDDGLARVSILDGSRIVAGTLLGDLIVLSHISGKSMNAVKVIKKVHSSCIQYITVFSNFMVTHSYKNSSAKL